MFSFGVFFVLEKKNLIKTSKQAARRLSCPPGVYLTTFSHSLLSRLAQQNINKSRANSKCCSQTFNEVHQERERHAGFEITSPAASPTLVLIDLFIYLFFFLNITFNAFRGLSSSKTSSGLPTSVDVGIWLNLLVWAGRLYGSSALRVLWCWKRSTVPSCFWYFHVIQINPDSSHFTFHDKKGADCLPASRKTLARVLSRQLRVYLTVVSPSREIHLCALKGQEWRSGGVHARTNAHIHA